MDGWNLEEPQANYSAWIFPTCSPPGSTIVEKVAAAAEDLENRSPPPPTRPLRCLGSEAQTELNQKEPRASGITAELCAVCAVLSH